ncbi:MMPL family transporter, partial [Nocardia gipuzkoensis]
MATTELRGTPSGTANAILVRDFSPGLLSPIQVVATGQSDTPLGPESRRATDDMGRWLAGDRRISTVIPLNSDGRMLWLAVPANPVDSAAAADVVRDIRAQGAGDDQVRFHTGGVSAQILDYQRETVSKTPLVVAIVLVLSLIFLTMVFRSFVLPIKAVLINLLVTGAALGLTVAIFQWG